LSETPSSSPGIKSVAQEPECPVPRGAAAAPAVDAESGHEHKDKGAASPDDQHPVQSGFPGPVIGHSFFFFFFFFLCLGLFGLMRLRNVCLNFIAFCCYSLFDAHSAKCVSKKTKMGALLKVFPFFD
jgi:hypothetical protein